MIHTCLLSIVYYITFGGNYELTELYDNFGYYCYG